MKISGAALPHRCLFLFLVVSVALALNGAGPGSQVQDEDDDLARLPTPCCSNHTKNAVPCRLIKSYHYTAAGCPVRAIVFVTWKDIEICANPGDAWVQRCCKKLLPPEY